MSDLDGSQLETLLSQEAGATPPTVLVAEAWSADGQTLYFSKEPVGLGGYILFSGASNLYKIDVTTKQVTELIPEGSPSGPVICLDAISGDYRYVAEHCTQGVITIRDMTSGGTTTILPPEGAAGFQVMGNARFSPDGSRVAFALAKSNPDNEQGWVAVSDSLSGGSKLVLSGPEGAYYTMVGWLDDQTLLVQLTLLNCTSNCENQVWTVNVDGSNPAQVAEGSLLTVIDNR
jgi:Tol biopolymer transport system component